MEPRVMYAPLGATSLKVVLAPVPAYRPEARTSAAALLRGFHEATADLAAGGWTGWQMPSVGPAEVVCHNDVAPYNCVVRDGRVVAFIDFDTAGPGPRAWDLAYALYRFAPLSQEAGDVRRQGERARLFLDAYGADRAVRAEAVELVPTRLATLIGFMEAQARSGNAAYVRHIAERHAEAYRRDMAYAAANLPWWTSVTVAGVE